MTRPTVKYEREGVIALDLGTKTGYAHNLYDAQSLESGSLNFANKQRRESRSMTGVRLREWLTTLLRETSAKIVVYEEVRRHIGVDAAHHHGMMLAAMMEACDAVDVPFVSVPVAKIKQFATGKGNAKKHAMMEACFDNYQRIVKDDNEADAVHLFHYYQRIGG